MCTVHSAPSAPTSIRDHGEHFCSGCPQNPVGELGALAPVLALAARERLPRWLPIGSPPCG